MTFVADPSLEQLRTADRATYETLLAARTAMQAYTSNPTADLARNAIEKIDAHLKAMRREIDVLTERIEHVGRIREGVTKQLEARGESVERPKLPAQGAPIAFAPLERVPYPY